MTRRGDAPIRVALVAEATGGGVGRHVLDLAESLPAAGFDVLLLHGERRIGDGFGERLACCAEFGYRAVAVDMTRAPGVHDLAAGRAVRSALRGFGRVDVLHGQSSKGGALARLARWGVARRVVYTPHAFYTQNPTLSGKTRALYRGVEVALGALTDRIVTVSSAETAHAIELGLPRRKLVQIENGVEHWSDDELARTRAATRRRLGLAADDVVVGFLGRLTSQKAPERALRTFRLLLDANPRLRPVLVGDGPDADDVRRLLQELDLGRDVRWVPDGLGREMIPAFDVFLMTSRYEGFPYVLLEALNAGCAIVTTDVGGAPDCVRAGRNGFIVAADETALAATILDAAADPERLRALRRSSRALAGEFSIDRMIGRVADLYRSIHADDTSTQH